MVELLTILWGVGAILLGGGIVYYVISLYNRLVRVEKRAENAWADVDVLLKQRRDSIEKLADAAKQAMDFEEDLLTEIVAAREQVAQADSPRDEAAAGNAVRKALGQMNVRAEDYPEPKAIENLQHLQDEIAGIESQIADRREVYNAAATAHNELIRSIPYVVIANPLGFERRELYDPPESETTDVDVSAMFSDAGQEADTVGN